MIRQLRRERDSYRKLAIDQHSAPNMTIAIFLRSSYHALASATHRVLMNVDALSTLMDTTTVKLFMLYLNNFFSDSTNFDNNKSRPSKWSTNNLERN